jgi:hypothetical protein
MTQLRVQEPAYRVRARFVSTALDEVLHRPARPAIHVEGSAAEQAAATAAIHQLAGAPSAQTALRQLAIDGIRVRFVDEAEASAAGLGPGVAAMYDSQARSIYVRMGLRSAAGALIHEATHHLAAVQGRDAAALLRGTTIEQALRDPASRVRLWAARVSDEAGAYRQQALVMGELGASSLAPRYAMRADGTVATALETYRAFDRDARQDEAGQLTRDYDRIQHVDTFSAAEQLVIGRP